MSKCCEECGLPFAVCNSLASYREAVKYFKLGRLDEAERCAESAEEFFSAYRAGQPATCEIKRLRAGLRELADNPCMDPDGNSQHCLRLLGQAG